MTLTTIENLDFLDIAYFIEEQYRNAKAATGGANEMHGAPYNLTSLPVRDQQAIELHNEYMYIQFDDGETISGDSYSSFLSNFLGKVNAGGEILGVGTTPEDVKQRAYKISLSLPTRSQGLFEQIPFEVDTDTHSTRTFLPQNYKDEGWRGEKSNDTTTSFNINFTETGETGSVFAEGYGLRIGEKYTIDFPTKNSVSDTEFAIQVEGIEEDGTGATFFDVPYWFNQANVVFVAKTSYFKVSYIKRTEETGGDGKSSIKLNGNTTVTYTP